MLKILTYHIILKLILLSFVSITINSHLSIFILIIILIVILFNIESIALKFNLSSRWDDDILSYSLIILTLYLIFIIFISQTKTLYKSNLYGLLMILLIFFNINLFYK